ncbi:activity-dependent neuroprotector homeobox protein 2-like [Oncorhynchus keta]|uniref:activity-dependent neuroprotector homeobox protein 2-like n=1 Tax=Oncorhynchus keta TaxID=8018 RepID=UPI0015FA8F22|nr:activity-dependent neuroprotector homeobox protein 2-like [Oncorhynchus keta]
MYQVPVGNLENIRKTRRRVKHILSDFGLEDCKNLLEELQKEKKNSDEESDSDEAFRETEWVDLSEPFPGKRKKKWPYRTRLLCCSLCKYSTRNWYSYTSHLQRSHEYERKLCVLAPCQICSFVAHPRLLKKHLLLFHGSPNVDQDAASLHSTTKKGDRFKCRKCRYVDSNLFSMKKHVLLNHLEKLWHHFSGRIPDTKFPHTASRQFCKVCKMAIESTEHMLHHILASPTHQWACAQIRTWILENTQYAKPTNYQTLAPKKQMPQVSSPEQLAGPNQSFLPPQALVQLAGAEAKGLVQPGATVKLQSALPQGAISATMPIGQTMVRLPSGASLPGAPHNQVPFTIGVQGQQQQPQQVFLPPRVQISIPGMSQALMVTQRLPLNQGTPQGTMLQSNPQGTMLTSQSLLSHLFPTGNKVNGMPTYTFATPVGMPSQTSNIQLISKAPQPIKPAGNPALNSKAKKWITCPICNELLPSNVYEAHQQAAHKAQPRTAKQQGLAARAPFLRKMPDKTVKCLKCKILLSEKGLFEHLLHGLNCLYCPGMFYSIQQLVEHTNTQHNPTQKANCDFMRREYRLYTDDSGNLLFPYFDINTMAPKEILGDAELKLALVTNSLDLIFLKMQPGGKQEVCRNPSKTMRTDCPFCEEKCVTVENYQAHLSGKHCIAPTVHAILKTAAFKCIYCNGVYTGKTTQRAIVIHLQRCRRAPKTPKDADRLQPAPTNGRQQQVMAFKQMVQVPGLYSAQLPPVPMAAQASVPVPQPSESPAELQSKLRLEAAFREAMEANKKERDARAAFRKQREKEKREQVPKMDPYIQLALDPSGMEKRPSEERKDFLTRYFHTKPYPTKKESEELSKRLWLTRTEVSTLFGMKRTKCMKAIQKNSPTIFMGFNMTELKKLKHDLLIPEVEPAEPEKMADPEVEPDEPEQTDLPEGEKPEISVPKEDPLEPRQMDVPEMDPLEPHAMAV